MGVFLGMFRELARLGVTRAAAFFYAVAVGVAANIIIAHFSPHDGADPLPALTHSTAKPADAPVATAVIAPRPAEKAKPTEPTAPVSIAAPPPPPAAPPPGNVPAVDITGAPPAPPASAALPTTAAMAPPPLRPAALPPRPVEPTALPSPPPGASTPLSVDTKPILDNKPAGDVEAATGARASAPISLLPTDQPADQPPPKPAKPGPGSGGLY